MTQVNAPTAGAALTALRVARIREQESRRPDRLYDDPLASAFVEAACRDFARIERGAARWARVEALAEQFFAGRSGRFAPGGDRLAAVAVKHARSLRFRCACERGHDREHAPAVRGRAHRWAYLVKGPTRR